MTSTSKTAMTPVQIQSPEKPFRIEETPTGLTLIAHGLFNTVEHHTSLITDLMSYAESYNMIEIWISGPGGVVDTLLEIAEALSNFDTVITICNSSASSASAMLWSLGDIRVASPLASFMWHRESYAFSGKTPQHEDFLEKQKKIFPLVLEECSGSILTEEDKSKALYTEVYYTGQEMIDSGNAIPFTQYLSNKNSFYGSRFTPMGTLVRDNHTNKIMCVDNNSGMAETVGQLIISDYSYPVFQSAVYTERRVIKDNNEVILDDEEFGELEDQFLSPFEGNPSQDDINFNEDPEVN